MRKLHYRPLAYNSLPGTHRYKFYEGIYGIFPDLPVYADLYQRGIDLALTYHRFSYKRYPPLQTLPEKPSQRERLKKCPC